MNCMGLMDMAMTANDRLLHMTVKRYRASLFIAPGHLSEPREVVLASDYDAMAGVALELHSRLEDSEDKCPTDCWCCAQENRLRQDQGLALGSRHLLGSSCPVNHSEARQNVAEIAAPQLKTSGTATTVEDGVQAEAGHSPSTHQHVGSPTVDRGETCLKCGKDMHDPVHSQSQTESRPLAPDLGEKSAKHDAAVTDKAGERGLGSQSQRDAK